MSEEQGRFEAFLQEYQSLCEKHGIRVGAVNAEWFGIEDATPEEIRSAMEGLREDAFR